MNYHAVSMNFYILDLKYVTMNWTVLLLHSESYIRSKTDYMIEVYTVNIESIHIFLNSNSAQQLVRPEILDVS